jgi:hypothetical protein
MKTAITALAEPAAVVLQADSTIKNMHLTDSHRNSPMKNKLKILSILFLLLAGSITLTSCGDDDDDSSSSSFTLKGSGS